MLVLDVSCLLFMSLFLYLCLSRFVVNFRRVLPVRYGAARKVAKQKVSSSDWGQVSNDIMNISKAGQDPSSRPLTLGRP